MDDEKVDVIGNAGDSADASTSSRVQGRSHDVRGIVELDAAPGPPVGSQVTSGLTANKKTKKQNHSCPRRKKAESQVWSGTASREFENSKLRFACHFIR